MGENSISSIYNVSTYVLVYTPSLLGILRVFQNQYKQISQLVPPQRSNPEPPAWKSGVLPPEPPVLLFMILVNVFASL